MTPYQYSDAAPTYANAYLWPALKSLIGSRSWPDTRAFDLGCRNGVTGGIFSRFGLGKFANPYLLAQLRGQNFPCRLCDEFGTMLVGVTFRRDSDCSDIAVRTSVDAI